MLAPGLEVAMRTVTNNDLAGVLVWVRGGGFPGELREEDVARARTLLEASPAARAVLVDLGSEELAWIEPDSKERVRVAAGERPAQSPDEDAGYRLGVGDGATLPGLPTSWGLLRFACPSGDTTVLLASYPAQVPRCPDHDLPLELRQGDRDP
jgi:hypothetical protein